MNENSISNPTNIIPVISTIHSDSSVLNYIFKANSVNVLKLNVDIESAVNLPERSTNMEIYPTFTQNEIYIKNSAEGKSTVCVLNSTGQQLISEVVSGLQKINLTNLNTGIYLIRVTNGTRTIVKKVIRY